MRWPMEENRCYGCMKIKLNNAVCEHCGYREGTQNTAHQLPAGTILQERYLIGRVLGQGGFGITYLGWDMHLDIPVAIKEYFPHGAVARETTASMNVMSFSGEAGERFHRNKERFLKEAKMLAQFTDAPEIVQVRNFFLENETAYIVMEYVEGITLKEYVKAQGGKLTVAETLSLMRPVMQALDKVHHAGLIHRDISPENIMLLSEGGVKLLDFGSGRNGWAADVQSQLTQSTEAILKQGYSPIEQYQNRGSLGPWTDVYALCATIYFCLTGEAPPDAPERLLGEEEIDFKGKIPELSEEQVKILRQGMMLRAQKRIPAMDVLERWLYFEGMQEEKHSGVQKLLNRFDIKWIKERFRLEYIWYAATVILTIALSFSLVRSEIDGYKENVASTSVPFVENPIEMVSWSLDDGILHIRGNGAMEDYNGIWMEKDAEEYDEGREYAPWADRMGEITKIVMSDSITHIGDNAFVGAVNLKEVEWSDSLQTIGARAFSDTGLEQISLPYSIETMEEFAFDSCKDLKHVELPYRLVYLEAGTFMDCTALEDVIIRPYTSVETDKDEKGKIHTPFSCEENDQYIESEKLTIHTYKDCSANAFAEKYGYPLDYMTEGRCGDDITWSFDTETKTLSLEGSGQTWVYNIKEEDLDGWRAEFPYGWVYCEMPDWFYSYREEIETIVVGEGIKDLNAYVFGWLPNLKAVDLGTVQFIDYAFYNCDGLKEIVLPSSLNAIGAESFRNCINLRKVEILGDDAEIRWDAFLGANRLEEVYCSKRTWVNEEWGSGSPGFSKKATLYVYNRSDMHRFAEENGYSFEFIENEWR